MKLELRIDKILNELNNLIKNIDEIKLDKMNMTIHQFKKIVYELEQMKKYLSPKEFRPSYVHIIIDSWDFKEEKELHDELLKIESDYTKIGK